MSVYTEAIIRKLYKEMAITDNGIFELDKGKKLTPAARSFLTDHHIHIVHSNQQDINTSSFSSNVKKDVITTLEQSAVYPLLFRLTKLYPRFLKCQRELHLAFQNEKCDQVGRLLKIIENMVGKVLLDELSDYQESLANNKDLEEIRVNCRLDQQHVLLTYNIASWQLASYDCYIELVLLRREFAQQLEIQEDPFVNKLINLLKSLEVLLWLVISE